MPAKRKPKRSQGKQRLQPDVDPKTAFAIKMEATRNNCTVGSIIERLAEAITAKWEMVGAK